MNKSEEFFQEKVVGSANDWHLSRKTFIRTLVLSGIAFQLPWLESCSTDSENFGDTAPLSLTQFKTVREVQNILFPEDGNGPGAFQVHADRYLIWILNDPLLDSDEGMYIIKQIDEFNKASRKEFTVEFHELSPENQLDLVTSVAKEDWGKKWFSRLLTLIFEALLLDPVYGGNTKGIGWDWLDHDPGFPRPVAIITYPEILKHHEI